MNINNFISTSVCLAVTLFIYCTGCSKATPPSSKQPSATTTEDFRKSAEQGDAKAQFVLGYCYETGRDVTTNFSEAAKWYRKAAEQGNDSGQVMLGTCYLFGRGVEQSYAEAAMWFRKAAEQGNSDAQYNLGKAYMAGQGVETNYAEGVKWFRKAAEQGDQRAQFNMGVFYGTGLCVETNLVEAVKWYRMAADQGNDKAQYSLGIAYASGTGVAKDSPEAIKWLSKSAEKNNLDALYSLGVAYSGGQGVNQNYSNAVKWYRKAAEQGHALSQFKLGSLYYVGYGIETNYVEAAKWFQKAAEQGHPDAQYTLGMSYFYGYGVAQNKTEGLKWFRKSAEQGNVESQKIVNIVNDENEVKEKDNVGAEDKMRQLMMVDNVSAEQFQQHLRLANDGNTDEQVVTATCYWGGKGVNRNITEAMKWYRKAAEQGNGIAQTVLGLFYGNGQGVETNYVESTKWYRKAADQGLADAQYHLGLACVSGEGGIQDYTEAAKWFRKAAQGGNTMSQYFLGVCYISGKGVTANPKSAYSWLLLASASGNQDAAKLSEDLKNNLSLSEQREANEWVKNWKPKQSIAVANDGHVDIPKGQTSHNSSSTESVTSVSHFDLPKAGLVISLPDAWIQIPDEELQSLIQQTRAKAPKINTPSYVYGFRKMPEVPLATIVINVRAGKMPQAELDKIPSVSNTKECAKDYAKDVERRSLGFLKDMKLGEPTYDRRHGIIWMKMSVGDVMGNGGIKGISAVIIGEKREVQLTGYCDEAIFESFCPEFEGIVYSARMAKINAQTSKSLDRSLLPLDKAILGDWAVCFEGKQSSFTHRLYEDGTYTMSNAKKTTVLQYRVVRQDETDRTIILRISNKESGKGHQKTLHFSIDKLQAHETMMFDTEDGKNNTIETTWTLLSCPPVAINPLPGETPASEGSYSKTPQAEASDQRNGASNQTNKRLVSENAKFETLKQAWRSLLSAPVRTCSGSGGMNMRRLPGPRTEPGNRGGQSSFLSRIR